MKLCINFNTEYEMKLLTILATTIFITGANASSSAENLADASTSPITQVKIHFLNGNSDLLEAIEGKSDFAKKAYGATDMTQYKLKAQITLSNGEVLDVTTDKTLYELKTPITTSQNIKAKAKILAFDRQDFEGDYFSIDSWFALNQSIDPNNNSLTHLAIRLMGPAISFCMFAYDPVTLKKAIEEDRQSKLTILEREELKDGEGLNGFLQLVIPYTSTKTQAN